MRPRGRAPCERAARGLVHGEQLEKERLKRRTFGFQRYEGDNIDRPFAVFESSESYRSGASFFF